MMNDSDSSAESASEADSEEVSGRIAVIIRTAYFKADRKES